jgi:hypothetical protein
MSDNQGVASSRPALLPWIVAFKAVKATTLTAVGILLLASRHADPMDLLLKTALAVHLPLTSRVFARAVALVDNPDGRQRNGPRRDSVRLRRAHGR